jgi:hypothetical protein
MRRFLVRDPSLQAVRGVGRWPRALQETPAIPIPALVPLPCHHGRSDSTNCGRIAVFDARVPGMGDPKDLRDALFLAAIAAETRTALRAYDRLNLLLVRLRDLPTDPDEDTPEQEWDDAESALSNERWDIVLDVWAEVFLVLSATANVSKMFHLSGPAKDRVVPVARALRIRDLLGIEDPRAWSRDVRDALEHFDERLDQWLADDPLYWADRMVMPASEVAELRWMNPSLDDWKRSTPMRVLRNLDPETLVVEVFGPTDGRRETSVPLREVVIRLRALGERVDAAQAALLDSLGPSPD